MNELSPDQKGRASLTLGDVIVQTRTNHPDPRFHPEIFAESKQYHRYGINTYGYPVWPNVDGIGTKPEFAERLFSNDGDPSYFETLAFDTFAMVESDVARTGEILLGIAHIIDMNDAQNVDVVAAIANGTKRACDEGRFALLNGETAELSYRSSGYGSTKVNWNACGISLKVPAKFISGEQLEPGQPLVALREVYLRSNGFTKARKILEAAYLHNRGFQNMEDFFISHFSDIIDKQTGGYVLINRVEIFNFLNGFLGHGFLEQALVPWHRDYPEATREILGPSRLYSPLIYEAQGGIDGEKLVNITGAAHISGGGVPEKGKRMVEDFGLGLGLESPFPDPKAVTMLMEIARGLPNEGTDLIDDRIACQQWNRGIGFMVATATLADADNFIQLATEMGYEAVIAGEVTNKKAVEFRGHTWTY